MSESRVGLSILVATLCLLKPVTIVFIFFLHHMDQDFAPLPCHVQYTQHLQKHKGSQTPADIRYSFNTVPPLQPRSHSCTHRHTQISTHLYLPPKATVLKQAQGRLTFLLWASPSSFPSQSSLLPPLSLLCSSPSTTTPSPPLSLGGDVSIGFSLPSLSLICRLHIGVVPS